VTDERRLIEEFLPVREIGREASREKSAGRDYHLSTLHWWWARRPLAAARAAVFATLVPGSALPESRNDLERFFGQLTAWRGDEIGLNPSALEKARKLIEGEWPTPPKIIDSFAGGGAIPLEALRLGADAAAVELSPVAFLVSCGTLVWPQTYGASLAADVQRWAKWVRDRALEDVADLYPDIGGDDPADDGAQLALDSGEASGALRPVAYLWTRTVPCPNPALEPHRVPLIRSTHVVRTDSKRIAVKVVPDPAVGSFRFVLEPESGRAREPQVRHGRSSASACQLCGAPISAKYLKEKGDHGEIGHQLVAVICARPGRQGKHYLSADATPAAIPDARQLEERLAALADEGLTVPDDMIQPMGNAGLASGETYLYGIRTFGDVFTRRQLVTLLTLCKHVRRAHELMIGEGTHADLAAIVAAYLGMIVNRVVDRSTALCRWNLTRETLESPFVRDRLAMLWDFAEVNPFGGISGDFTSAIDTVCKVIRHCARIDHPADLRRGTATDLPYDDGTFDAAIIDPPYYDNISYANSSDFYYVWLKRSIGHLFPEHFAGPVAPKRQEIVAAAYKHNKDKGAAAREYEQLMTKALEELQRVLKPAGSLVVVYAHQTTAGWSTLIGSLRTAGFTVVEAWPLDTERAQRRGGTDNASLASSIFLVARRRESGATGDWSAVQAEFERVIAERIATLADMGITGADLVIASIGAGLRPYTAYGRVELPNGDPLEPEAFLDEVQTTVVKTILSDLIGVSRSGVEAVDPVTQLYVIGRFEYGDSTVPFDEMNTLVHGVLAGARGGGVELLGPRGLTTGAAALVEQEKDTMRLRDFEERGHVEELGQGSTGSPNLIDVLHRLLWLAEHQPAKVGEYLLQEPPDLGRLHLVAHALSGSGLSGKGIGTSEREQHAIQRLLASWKHLVEDSLFQSRS